MCETYDIIDWKSCASLSSRSSNSSSSSSNEVIAREPRFDISGYGALSGDGICSTNDIVFPKLFNEDPESDQSGIISMTDMEYYGMTPYDYLKEEPPDGYEEQSVYQKVSSWVLSQRKYFLNSDPHPIEDDEMEVIDPVDLFHETILDEYFMITGILFLYCVCIGCSEIPCKIPCFRYPKRIDLRDLRDLAFVLHALIQLVESDDGPYQ